MYHETKITDGEVGLTLIPESALDAAVLEELSKLENGVAVVDIARVGEGRVVIRRTRESRVSSQETVVEFPIAGKR